MLKKLGKRVKPPLKWSNSHFSSSVNGRFSNQPVVLAAAPAPLISKKLFWTLGTHWEPMNMNE